MPTTDRVPVLRLARRLGEIRAQDARRAWIHSQQIARLVAEGVLERIARGRYRLADRPVTERHALVVAASQASVHRGMVSWTDNGERPRPRRWKA